MTTAETGAAAQKISEHLITVPIDDREGHNHVEELTLNGKNYCYYRSADKTFILRNVDVNPANFTDEDNQALNTLCERNREGKRNKRVKNVLADSITQYFNDQSLHINEIGCGYYPFIEYLDQENTSYHGIDTDPDCIQELHKMNYSASTWSELPKVTPNNKTHISVAIYAMHFLVNEDFARNILDLTDKNGFFIGNFYADIDERATFFERDKLETILATQGLAYNVLRDKDNLNSNNEYWVIGRATNKQNIDNYAKTLQETIKTRQDRTMAIHSPTSH